MPLGRLTRLAPLLLTAAAFITGCTLLGSGLGALMPKAGTDREMKAWEAVTLGRGARVELYLRDGSTVAGRLGEFALLPLSEYVPRYAKARAALAPERDLPALGPAELHREGRETLRGELLGFGWDFVLFRRGGRSSSEQLPLSSIAIVRDAERRWLDRASAQALLADGALPVVQGVRVNRPGGVDFVALDDVVSVRGHHRQGSYAGEGALAGAVLDGLVLITAMLNSPPPTTSSQPSSCPYVYSFDGQGYVLDAEPFPGAIVEPAQWTDRVRLERLQPAAGEYRLRLANELPEIDHVDALKLLAVEHAAGTEAWPDAQGRVHLLAGAAAPIAAADLRGASVLSLVGAADGRSWMADPVRRAAHEARDGLLLEFTRPRAARGAVLAVTARSTPWASALLHQVLQTRGAGLVAWQEQVAHDPLAQLALLRLASEVVPSVAVWDGAGWRAVGQLWSLPTVVDGRQAVVVDLAGLPADALRVKLEGVPGTWTADAVRAAFDVAEAQPFALPARSARTRGRDILGPLSAVDHVRHSLARGEVVDLAFAVPPGPAAGLRRSLVLEATGYYTVLMPEGPAQPAASFDRLLAEPGAVSLFARDRARQAVRAALADSRAGSREPLPETRERADRPIR